MQTNVHKFTTIETPPDQAFGIWLEMVRSSITRFSMQSDNAENFFGSFVTRQLGPLNFAHIVASHQHGFHDTHAGCDEFNRMDLCYVSKGKMHVRQNGKDVDVGAEQFLLINHREKFDFITGNPTACFNISFPIHWLDLWLPDPESCALTLVSRGDGNWSQLMSSLLYGIGDNLENTDWVAEGILADQIGGALALIYDQLPKDISRHRSKLFRQMLSTMRTEFSDCELTPQRVANANGISVRYLHSVFAGANTTYRRELKRIRLERAKQFLIDHRYHRHSIGEIAYLCGFSDPAYMTRCFKEEYGRPPSALKQIEN